MESVVYNTLKKMHRFIRDYAVALGRLVLASHNAVPTFRHYHQVGEKARSSYIQG